jgi:ribosomal protein S18 acetylase RimI-like enzyme
LVEKSIQKSFAGENMIQIRQADPKEANILTQIALAAKAHWGYPKHWIEMWTPELTFDASYFETNPSWVAIDDEGFYTLLDHHGIAWIGNLWVMPEFIGLGVGKQLFHHALGVARQRGYTRLQLEADPNAIGFYEKMGMHKISERHYDMEGQSRILPIMEISL